MRGSHLQHPLERRSPVLQQPLHARDSTDDDIDILRRRRDRLLLLHLRQRERDRRQLRRRELQPPGDDFCNILRAAFLYESFFHSFYGLTIWVCKFLAKGF
jgi:hypothetical protein